MTQYMGHTVVSLPWWSGQGSGGLVAVGAGHELDAIYGTHSSRPTLVVWPGIWWTGRCRSWTQYMGHTVVDLPWSSGQGSGGLGAL